MMRHMMKWCCGPDGRPVFDKMTEYIERHDRTGWSDFGRQGTTQTGSSEVSGNRDRSVRFLMIG